MKQVLKIGKIALLFIVIFLTTWDLFLGSKLIFSDSTNQELSTVFTSNKYIQLCLMILLLWLVWKLNNNSSKIRISLSILVLFLWFISGRAIGVEFYPDGKIYTGWFYFPTNKIQICSKNNDCEEIIYSEIEIQKLPFWFIRINNSKTSKLIFIGPFIWTKTIAHFKEYPIRGA